VTAREIYDLLHKKDAATDKRPHAIKVEGHIFKTKQVAIDTIHDIAAEIGFTLKKRSTAPRPKPA
jgi:hypothetical protein